MSQSEDGDRDQDDSRVSRTPFGELLGNLRAARAWSQGRLAKQAGLDPSAVSRLEAGVRAPERDTVQRLADALVLPMTERDRLLAAAGFRSIALDDPLISELAMLLADPSLPEQVQQELRAVIRVAIQYGRNARGL
jgi:transcriptional regulator with XRE-family HTH domain